jgi:hypothetical protein
MRGLLAKFADEVDVVGLEFVQRRVDWVGEAAAATEVEADC